MKKLVYLENPSLTGMSITKLIVKVLPHIPDDQKSQMLSIYRELYGETLSDLQKAYELGIAEGQKTSHKTE
jgi:hypothetical protein